MKNKVKINEKLTVGEGFCIIGGPCAIESLKQLEDTAVKIKDNIDILRGGAYKPRSSHQSFQGLKEEGLAILSKIAIKYGLITVTEVTDTRDVGIVSRHADIIQIGSRNMQNFALLKEVGIISNPVILKRGFASTIDEWLAASDYITAQGNKRVILCERGIRSFDSSNRFTLDLAGAVLAKQKSDLPVIVDPSHATGNTTLIEPLSLATQAAGLDGIMIETHCNPSQALCDGNQALATNDFNNLVLKLRS